jgi:hypothetical protein
VWDPDQKKFVTGEIKVHIPCGHWHTPQGSGGGGNGGEESLQQGYFATDTGHIVKLDIDLQLLNSAIPTDFEAISGTALGSGWVEWESMVIDKERDGDVYVAGYWYGDNEPYVGAIFVRLDKDLVIKDGVFDSGDNHIFAFKITVNPTIERCYVTGYNIAGPSAGAQLITFDISGDTMVRLTTVERGTGNARWQVVNSDGTYTYISNIDGPYQAGIDTFEKYDNVVTDSQLSSITDIEPYVDFEWGIIDNGIWYLASRKGWFFPFSHAKITTIDIAGGNFSKLNDYWMTYDELEWRIEYMGFDGTYFYLFLGKRPDAYPGEAWLYKFDKNFNKIDRMSTPLSIQQYYSIGNGVTGDGKYLFVGEEAYYNAYVIDLTTLTVRSQRSSDDIIPGMFAWGCVGAI